MSSQAKIKSVVCEWTNISSRSSTTHCFLCVSSINTFVHFFLTDTESGTTKDYIYGHLNVKYTFSMELRDTRKYGFLLPPGLIEPTAKEAFEGIKALVENIKLD